MPQVKITRSYVADDGKEFDTREACEAYELRDMLKPLTKMTAETLEAILAGQDETRAALLRKVVSALSKPASTGEKAPRHRRTKDEIAADLRAKLAKIEGQGQNYAMEGETGRYAAE